MLHSKTENCIICLQHEKYPKRDFINASLEGKKDDSDGTRTRNLSITSRSRDLIGMRGSSEGPKEQRKETTESANDTRKDDAAKDRTWGQLTSFKGGGIATGAIGLHSRSFPSGSSFAGGNKEKKKVNRRPGTGNLRTKEETTGWAAI